MVRRSADRKQSNLPAVPRLRVQNILDLWSDEHQEAVEAVAHHLARAPCRRDTALDVLLRMSDGALEKMISPVTGSALAISLWDLATPRSLMGAIRKCISCSRLDINTVSE